MASKQVLKLVDYQTQLHNDWCPGCGDFGILRSIQMTLAEMQLDPSNVAIVSGIGGSAKTVHYVKTYGIHTLHGRPLPFATGVKLANPGLEVVACGGGRGGLGSRGPRLPESGRGD